MTITEIAEITNPADLEAAFAIRRDVFCAEQRVDPEEEFDGLDNDCRQYLAFYGRGAVGTARIRDAGDGTVKIERVAVLASARGKGIGRALMERTIVDARAMAPATIAIHAQCHAEGFYRSLGFRTIGGVFDEADIPHVRMVLD